MLRAAAQVLQYVRVGAQEHVTAAAHAVGEGHDGVAGLFVKTVRWGAGTAGQAVNPFCGRLPQFPRVLAALPTVGRCA
jgi:hypothetical protein